MNNQLILLETIRDFSAGISQQQDHINLDNLVNPLIPNPDVNNLVDPMGINVGQPENQPIRFVLCVSFCEPSRILGKRPLRPDTLSQQQHPPQDPMQQKLFLLQIRELFSGFS